HADHRASPFHPAATAWRHSGKMGCRREPRQPAEWEMSLPRVEGRRRLSLLVAELLFQARNGEVQKCAQLQRDMALRGVEDRHRTGRQLVCRENFHKSSRFQKIIDEV